jgi:predicted phosphate transport protein (TIGR00153 family)
MWRKLSAFPLRGIEANLREHINLVVVSVELLDSLISACEDYNWDLVADIADRIALLEREDDDVKRRVEKSLYTGVVFVGLKEDFYKLAESLDQIADKAKDASRALASRRLEREECAVLFQGETNIREMVTGTVEIVKLIQMAVGVMNKSMKEALGLAHEVEKLEEKLDDIKLVILRNLTANEKRLSPISYLQLRDFVFLLDMIADEAEATSDVITEMIMKSGA